ncbi:MAG: hypothetical protein KC933_24605 [Myxococcales bacterium]|nr:hypothetical protein [Myxococcales bacterium]MCB9645152.1 hypothetical protein [Deltaproteobacteria bacterium]
MIAASLVCLAALASPPPPPPAKAAGPAELARTAPYDPLDASDQEAMAKRLLLHVPMLQVAVKDTGAVLGENPRTGYGVVLAEDRIIALSFLVQDASAVTLVGPKGHGPAKVAVVDHERRVAVLVPEVPLASLGLYPVKGVVPKRERVVDMSVFALVSTLELAGVAQGVLTDTGDQEELEGHPRVDLTLERGMPVFDARARFLGYARAVAWDRDRRMLVPPEQIKAARTATAAPPRPPTQKTPSRPWWAR